jgi:hypothetical protein
MSVGEPATEYDFYLGEAVVGLTANFGLALLRALDMVEGKPPEMSPQEAREDLDAKIWKDVELRWALMRRMHDLASDPEAAHPDKSRAKRPSFWPLEDERVRRRDAPQRADEPGTEP